MKKLSIFSLIIIVIATIFSTRLFSYWHNHIHDDEIANGSIHVGNSWNDFYNLNYYQYEDGVIDVLGGYNHSFYIDSNLNAYAFGNNNYGKLGIGAVSKVSTPTLINGINNVIRLSSKNTHTLALTKEGEVYSFGLGTHGALGHGNTSSFNTPQKIDYISDAIDIATGNNISIILTKTAIYVAGTNKNYAMGIADTTKNITNFTKLDFFDSIKIKSVYATENSFYALSVDGKLYSWGNNTNGELGIGSNTSSYTINQISCNDEIITQVSAGANHLLVLTETNNTYSFGSNIDYQLGVNDNANRNLPTKIDNSFNEMNYKIKYLGTSSNSSFLVLENDQVYVFGDNSLGQLGLEQFIAYEKTPQYSELLSNKKVKKITGGYGQSFVLSSNMKLFGFGYNGNGELGLGSSHNSDYGVIHLLEESVLSNKQTYLLMPYWDIIESINRSDVILYLDIHLSVPLEDIFMPRSDLDVYGCYNMDYMISLK